MSKSCAVLIGLTFLAFSSPSLAAPLDSADTIYIDGLPCGRACQSYMAWSRAARPQEADRTPAPTEQAPPLSRAATSSGKEPKFRPNATGGRVAKKNPIKPTTLKTQPARRPEMSPASSRMVSSPVAPAPGPDLADSNEQQTSAIPPSPTEAPTSSVPSRDDNANNADPQSAAPLLEKSAALPPSSAEERIAILLVRPDIKSAADLANKVVAIDGAQSSSLDELRTAITAAGATDVQMNLSASLALLRIMNGEVPAAVVDLLPSAAAESWGGDIRGFNVLRIPLRAAIGTSDKG
jgi:hypothetical protein